MLTYGKCLEFAPLWVCRETKATAWNTEFME